MVTPAKSESLPPRRAAQAGVATAIELGWRVAALHALSPSALGQPPADCDGLLLNRRSLGAVDRLELELRAIAGVAARVEVPLDDEEQEALAGLASAAAASPEGEQRLRDALADRHLSLAKRLWAQDEARGRAYELGNFVSDTWNRLLHPRKPHAHAAELGEIFARDRVARMKVLLDDLQTRLDPAAVHVVATHLDAWRDRVAQQPPGDGDGDRAATALSLAQVAEAYEPLERQTIIWRQMLTGDKEPEAYINHARRAQARDELLREMWRRYRRFWWLLPIVAVVGGAIGLLLVRERTAAAGVIGTLTAVGGMVGVTRASLIASARRGLQDWGELMWNRALAAVICRETLVVDELLPVAGEQRPRR
jgi:hypothetical protein